MCIRDSGKSTSEPIDQTISEAPVSVATDQSARVTITLQTYPSDIPPPATSLVGSFSLKDSCLVLEDKLTKSKVVPVFPEGTTFDQERETLETFWGDTLVLGETYRLQGAIVGDHIPANQDCPKLKAIIGRILNKGKE